MDAGLPGLARHPTPTLAPAAPATAHGEQEAKTEVPSSKSVMDAIENARIMLGKPPAQDGGRRPDSDGRGRDKGSSGGAEGDADPALDPPEVPTRSGIDGSEAVAKALRDARRRLRGEDPEDDDPEADGGEDTSDDTETDSEVKSGLPEDETDQEGSGVEHPTACDDTDTRDADAHEQALLEAVLRRGIARQTPANPAAVGKMQLYHQKIARGTGTPAPRFEKVV